MKENAGSSSAMSMMTEKTTSRDRGALRRALRTCRINSLHLDENIDNRDKRCRSRSPFSIRRFRILSLYFVSYIFSCLYIYSVYSPMRFPFHFHALASSERSATSRRLSLARFLRFGKLDARRCFKSRECSRNGKLDRRLEKRDLYLSRRREATPRCVSDIHSSQLIRVANSRRNQLANSRQSIECR